MSTRSCSPSEFVARGHRYAADALLAGIVDAVGDAVVATDEAQRIIVFNRGAQALFGHAPEEALGRPLERLIPPESRSGHAELVNRFAEEGQPSRRMGERVAIEGVRRDGSRFPAGATIARVEGEFGRVFVAVVRDISRHVKTRTTLEASLRTQEELARTDPLTGLGNRRSFRYALERAHEHLHRFGRPFTLIYMDIDHFKPVNDRFGHALGDLLLQDIARDLQGRFRPVDTVARVGGDEFAVVSPDSDGAAVGPRLTGLRLRLADDLRGRGTGVTASIGVLTFRSAPEDSDTCLQEADRLMYRVKHATRDAIAYGVFDPEGVSDEAG